MRKVLAIAIIIFNFVNSLYAQSWPTPRQEAKAGTRWWWLGSAVDRDNLRWNLSEYARTGIGTVEITPLYGVQGNEKNELSFLSPQWMSALKDVQDISKELGIEVDMNCGTGWPFGGPHVPLSEAACKAIFHDSIVGGKHFYTVELGNTRQKVKRAAPGGEGWVIDHFDKNAVRHYLDRFEQAFSTSGVAYPQTFFNDSYEVSFANWTPTLFDEFQKRRGYDLRQHLPELLGTVDDGNKVLCDYRETLSDLLYENFTQQWVEWAHSHGVLVRNQAHGSPANLLDLYAAVDIPEIEGFGLSEFGIKGLRTDPGMTKKNFSDVSMLKYASSAAHVMGKPLTSSETFTWLTEHFRTSLSQMKPDLDLMFTCGVNHMFFHGSCYTPKDAPWPGWKFYASIDMSPTNSIWRDAPYMMQYIERCQSFLQMGKPDNDFLVYLPVRDMWRKRRMPTLNREPQLGDDLLMQFDIHSMEEKAPEFIHSILTIDSLGYDCDYISDRQLAKVKVENGMLVTEGGTRYSALIIPTGTTIDDKLKALLDEVTPYIIYGEDATAMAKYAKAETLRTDYGLRVIRRQNDKGYHYFIANLTPNDICGGFDLAAGKSAEALWFNPMTGNITPVETLDNHSMKISLRSGESIILQTSKLKTPTSNLQSQTSNLQPQTLEISSPWTLSFIDEEPRVKETFTLPNPQTWESLSPEAAVTMGTGVYTTTIRLSAKQAKQQWLIDLGDVRESARVYINDKFIGCAWAVPFILDCGDALKKGKNTLRIEVTNLPANRISNLDRKQVPWRKMKEINMVNINYQKTSYADWAPMPSGLNSPVRLIPQQ
ncbi:MAG: glycosyl hydrolase family 2 [Prevotella sp.]|nr:glycosyl hydrolase family 2 [Prevotella sp.]